MLQTTLQTTLEKITRYEDVDRFISDRVLHEIFAKTGLSIKITEQEISSPVDLYVEVYNPNQPEPDKPVFDFYVEVKTRNKYWSQFEQYGFNVELKKDKLTNIQRFTDKTVWYISLVNVTDTGEQTAFVFNLNTIDWSKIELFTWNIPVTQMQDNSPIKPTETYRIPMQMRKHIISAKPYYKEWYAINNQQSTEETVDLFNV